jgi:hypothetical protein
VGWVLFCVFFKFGEAIGKWIISMQNATKKKPRLAWSENEFQKRLYGEDHPFQVVLMVSWRRRLLVSWRWKDTENVEGFKGA